MRRKRYTPDRRRTTFRDTPEKRDILELLAQYKYLRSNSIHALLPERGNIGLRKTLRTLFDEGLITKPREQLRGYNNLYSPDIYMLAPKGERYLIERGKNPLSITRLYRQATDAPIKNFGHAMMICDTLSSIHAGANKEGVEFISWSEIVEKTDHPKPMKLPCNIEYKGQFLPTYVIPDGLFGLRYPDGKVSFFALEAERYNPIEPEKLTRPSFLKKYLSYRSVIKDQFHKTQLKIPNLRVLVVAPSRSKITHMIELVERLTTSTNLFMFHHIPVQEELMKAPPPFPELLTAKWRRAGMESISLYEKKEPH